MATKLSFIVFLAVIAVVSSREQQKVSSAQDIHVDTSGSQAYPINFSSDDYTGPYDPRDPNGIRAAAHRMLKLKKDKAVANIKSYVPPGIHKMAADEGKKVLVGEAKRFVLHNPVEASLLLDIAAKSKSLVNHAKKKMIKVESEESGHKKH